jgi:hypothetical protein
MYKRRPITYPMLQNYLNGGIQTWLPNCVPQANKEHVGNLTTLSVYLTVDLIPRSTSNLHSVGEGITYRARVGYNTVAKALQAADCGQSCKR